MQPGEFIIKRDNGHVTSHSDSAVIGPLLARRELEKRIDAATLPRCRGPRTAPGGRGKPMLGSWGMGQPDDDAMAAFRGGPNPCAPMMTHKRLLTILDSGSDILETIGVWHKEAADRPVSLTLRRDDVYERLKIARKERRQEAPGKVIPLWRGVEEASRKLSEDEKVLEKMIEYVEAYTFSSRMRPLIFGSVSGKIRADAFSDLMQRLSQIDERVDRLIADAELYCRELGQSKLFFQRKHNEMAKRFAYNGVTKGRLLKEALGQIMKDVESMRIAEGPRRHQAACRSMRKAFDASREYAKELNVLVSDVQGRIQVEENIVYEYEELKKYLISKYHLRTGDVLFSFKTKTFLGKTIIPRIIKLASSSQVTHALLAARMSPSDIRLIDSHVHPKDSGITEGLHLRNYAIQPGEVFIVMRPRISHLQKASLLGKIIEHVKKKPGFSDLKIAGAIASLAITKVKNRFTSGYALVPNIVHVKKPKFFCSEFINQVFHECRILLTPKSQYSSIVAPSNLIVSPYLDFVGLIFRRSERSEKIIKAHLKDVAI